MTTKTSKLLLLAALAAALPAVLAAQTVTELYVSPDTLRLEAGQRQGLSAQAFDDAGNAVLAIRFRSSDTLIAKVAENGTVSAVTRGRARVVIEAGSKSRTVTILVNGPAPAPELATARAAATVPKPRAPAPSPPPAAAPVVEPAAPPAPAVIQLTAEPASLELLPSEPGRIALRALRADGSVGAPEKVIWRSTQPQVVGISDSGGGIIARASGQAQIEATVPGGPKVSVPVTVTLSTIGADRGRLVLSPDDSDTISILVPSQGGRRLRPQDLVWSATDEAVLEVRPDGFVRALSGGRAEVVVRGFLQEVRVPVIVHQRVARFLVAPRLADTVRLPVETTREFSLIPQTVDSVPIEGVPITWVVGDTALAAFDPASGVLTAKRAGVTTLSFSSRGFLPKSWTIDILPGAIALERTLLALPAGERIQFTPQYVDQAGKPVGPARNVAWVTSNAGIVKVGADGGVEGVSPGRATITARAGNGPPASVTVFVPGDLLVTSTRAGRFGTYALLGRAPEQFLPLLADTFANHLDASYSPDRTRIAYASDRLGAGSYDIYVADADGRNPARLTTETGHDLHPAWTPDGSTLVFVSARSGVRQLYSMGADGGNVRLLTALAGGADEPVVSPDGRSIAFTGYAAGREDAPDIFVMPIEGGTPTAVTATRDRRESHPFYLPGGELGWVLHRKDKREPEQVLRQGPAGAPPVTLVSTELTVVDVAMARDGSRLAWVGSRVPERNGGSPEFTFQWRPLPGGADTSVRLLPGERITSPAF